MLPFTFSRALTEQEAIAAASAGGRYIAGGTTLIDLMREEVERPSALVDINALPYRDIRDTPDGLFIGALARMADVAENADVRRMQPLLSETLVEGASPQLRNVASIGGNLLQRNRCPYFRHLDAACNKRTPLAGCAAIEGHNGGLALFGTSTSCAATHPSDLAVSLVALGATLLLRGPEGERRIPVETLFRLPGDTPHLEHTLLPGELIIGILVPHGPYAVKARYLKVRDRASYEYALVSVAAAVEIRGGTLTSVRLAAGGVGTVPWRLRASEALIQGQPATRATYELAAARAIEGARPLSQNGFKVELLRRTVARALEMAGEVA